MSLDSDCMTASTSKKYACSHYEECGGCQLQHLSDLEISAQKTGIILEILKKHSLVPEKIYPIQTSAPQTRRRATLSAQIRDNAVVLGFYAKQSHKLIPIKECLIVTPAIQASFPFLRALAHLCLSKKELRLTVTDVNNGLDVCLQDTKSLHYNDLEEIRELCETFAEPLNLARVYADDTPLWQIKSPYHVFGTTRIMPPSGAFLQATKHGERIMVGFIKHHVKSATRILDLFSGCGALSLALIDSAILDAYDNNNAQIGALETGTSRSKVTAVVQNLFKNPVTNFSNYDAIIIDPPRAGALAQFTAIAQHGDCPVISVSCNPTTFARDARILCDSGYSLKEVLLIDQFRWSNHIEIIAFLKKHVDTQK